MAKKKTTDPPKRRFRAMKWILAGCALLVWFAPSIALRTPLKAALLDYANPGLNGTLGVTSGSVGWMSPIELRGVTVRDADGNVVAEAESVATQRTVWDLISDSTNIGELTVTKATARIEATSETSNLEQIIAPLFEGPSSGSLYAYQVNVVDANVTLVNRDSGRATQLAGINGTVTSTDLGNGYPKIELQLAAVPDETASEGGALTCSLKWTPGTKGEPIHGNVRVQGESVVLRSFAPVFHRFVPGIYADGIAKCDLAMDWSDDFDRPAYQFRGGLAISDLRVLAPQYLDADRLAVTNAKLAGSVQQAGDSWVFEQCKAQTDFASVTANGAMLLQDGLPVPSVEQKFVLNGTIDVADLANRLPTTLHLHDNLRMTKGVANVGLASERDEKGWFWDGSVRTDTLEAEQSGQRIAWKDPVKLDVRLRNHKSGYSVEKVSADCEFLRVTATGSLDDLNVRGDCDLNQLRSRLGEFVDLSGYELAGTVSCDGAFKRQPSGVFSAKATLRADQFALQTAPESMPWKEEQLVVQAEANGRMPNFQLSQMDTMRLTVVSGEDRLTAQLTAPVEAKNTSELTLPIEFRLKGQLQTWFPRFKPVLDVPFDNGTGDIDLTGKASVASGRVSISASTMDAYRLSIPVASDFVITESHVLAKLRGSVDLTKSAARISLLEWRGAAVQAAAKDVKLDFGDKLQATAACAITGDLALVNRWRRNAAGDEFTGRFQTNVTLKTNKNQIVASVDATLRDSNLLSYLDTVAPLRVAQDPNASTAVAQPATLQCLVRYNHVTDLLKVEKARLDSDALALRVGGTVKDVTTRMRTDVSGRVVYDFDQLNALLRASFGDHVRVTGKGDHPFEIRGPLNGNTENLAATASVSWDTASVFGLKCGPGTVKAKARGGVVRIDPIRFTVNGGKANLLPKLLLGDTPTLVLAKGTQIRDVELTKEVTSEWLRFVAPLLADSAQIHGRLSAGVSGATIPLADPAGGDIGGVVQIQQAQADPGPMLLNLVGVIDQVRTLIGKKARGAERLRVRVPEQNIAIRMVQRRVHHRDFALEIGGVFLKTSGSVGLDDETLDLTAELTLPDKWIGSSSVAKAIAGQGLKIPIRGTLSRPQVERNVLRGLGSGAAGGAVDDLLKNQLDRGLNKLFDKIR